MAKKDKEKNKAEKAEIKASKKKEKQTEELCSGNHEHGDLNAVREKVPSLDTLFQLAELFKMFGDSTRIRIMCVLFQRELCVCEIAELLELRPSFFQ